MNGVGDTIQPLTVPLSYLHLIICAEVNREAL